MRISVAIVYSWDAKDYRSNSSAQQQWAGELIGKLGLRGDERVLDIGSGDGKVTAAIARLLPRGSVLGIDASRAMVELARKEQTSSQYPNLEFRLQDATSMQFDGEFDVVFSNATLHWINDHQGLLRGIHRSLKPNGRMLVQMGGKGNASTVISVINDVIKSKTWSVYFNGFSFPYSFHGADEYKALLIDAGLKPIRVELLPKDMVQDGTKGLAGWIRTTCLPYIERIPDRLRATFVDAVVGGYVDRHPLDDEGKVHVPMERLEVEAMKDT
ncbi:MAG: methyltransferase domain-containing protein [Candidatus Sigynarchaeota archaeon]